MKNIFILISLLMTMFVEAVAQNDAMFVYRNDGAINGFLKSDIDSIRYSNLDVDSVLHKEYVVQEVWTVDSVYRIPLAAIDSVSFVTPPPSYQEGVEQVSEDLYRYVISYTDSTITFKPNIPSHLLPTEGQVIVADKYEEPFTTGFSGRMTGMKEYADSIVCMFDGVYLDDIYSRLLLVGSAESYNDEINQSRTPTRAIWKDYDRKINLPASIPLKAGLITAELERPSLKIDYLVCINEGSLQNHVMFKARFNSAGSLSLKVSKESTFVGDEPHWLSSIPIKVGVVSGSIEFGYFVQFSGSIEAGVTFPFEVGYSGGLSYTDSKGIVPDIPQRSFTWKEPEWKASINGSLYAGVASRLSIALLHTKVACIDLTGKFGPEVSSSYTIDAAEGIQTTLYDNLKDVEVTSSLKLELTPGYRVWFNERKEFGGINLSVEFLKKTVPLMPSISNLSWKRLSNKSGELNGNVENDIFLPCKLGWAIYSNDEYHSTHFLPDSYWAQDSWNNNGLQYQLSDIPSTGNCKAYPVVRYLDKLNIRVPKYVDLSIPVHITRFDVTDSEYKPGAFMNDGLYYDYKFNVSLTVEIDNLDGVEDWGYVYKDPNGKVKRISLMGYGTSYTDTRYAYYRNEAKSTVCLYGYVKYEGDDEYYYGEPHDYPLEYAVHTCPDNNHPHAIDLGLPSGTKWCCMNVGASSPEQYGGYYAWGETSEKSVYNWGTYLYATGGEDTNGDGLIDTNFSLVNIGSDIAGTSYDVAHVRMGGSWRMPSIAQQEELIDNCTRTLTQQNGVYGVLVTGNNGGQLFLPAAGSRWDGVLYYAGSYGNYWSSSLSPGGDNWAFFLDFDSGSWSWSIDSRSFGYSVRAVCP